MVVNNFYRNLIINVLNMYSYNASSSSNKMVITNVKFGENQIISVILTTGFISYRNLKISNFKV